MGSFFKILLVAVLIFYTFSMIVRFVFKRRMKKLQQHMEELQKDEAGSPSDEAKAPHVDPNIGEYTDFEEVE